MPLRWILLSLKYKVEFGYSASEFNKKYRGSCNGLVTDLGVHVNAASDSIADILAKHSTPGKKKPVLTNIQSQSGLRLFILVQTNEANYSSQTKESLKSIPKISRKRLAEAIYADLDKLLEPQSRDLKSILNYLPRDLLSTIKELLTYH